VRRRHGSRARAGRASPATASAARRSSRAASSSESALARTLAIEPQVLLLDEPLSNLDAKLRLQMREELLALHRRLGITTDLRHPRSGRGDDDQRPDRGDGSRA
jgi:ABC-type uncharacterized transport system YnjBCD ATPase subunit